MSERTDDPLPACNHPEFIDVLRLNVEPGDTLIFRVSQKADYQELVDAKNELNEEFPGVHIVVTTGVEGVDHVRQENE